MTSSTAGIVARVAGALVLCSSGCADDPVYIQPVSALEVNAATGAASTAVDTIQLPVRMLDDGQCDGDLTLERCKETAADADERQALADDYGLTIDDIPSVRFEDMSVSVEWTIKNLTDIDGRARIDINGANEWFQYVPDVLVIDPDDDDEAPPPALIHGVPLEIPAGATVTGVVREGLVREGAIDIELITRGMAGACPACGNPIAAVLQVNEDTTEFQAAIGMIDHEIFAGMVQFDLAFSGNVHMVLEYAIRVRDHRGLLHDELADAPDEELVIFTPEVYMPVVAAPMQ